MKRKREMEIELERPNLELIGNLSELSLGGEFKKKKQKKIKLIYLNYT